MDEEVADLLREAERTATALLADHRAALDRLADDLVARETLDGTAVEAALAGAGEPTLAVGSGDSALGEPHHDAPATSAARGV